MTLFFASLLARAKSIPILWWVVIILALLLLGTCTIHKITDAGKISRGEVVRDQKARDNASEARLDDALRRNDNKEKMNEATASMPDSRPSDRRLARECQRMRNDGVDRLPTFCGPAADRATPPRPG